jgi:hypothetical protein
MSVTTKCPGCQKTIAAPDSAAGHKARCPDCGAVVEIPQAVAVGPDAAQAVATPSDLPVTPVVISASDRPSAVRNGSRSSTHSTTAVGRLMSRTSPYGMMRTLALAIFGVGIALAVLVLLGGLTALIVLSVGGRPLIGIGSFVGGLVLAGLILLWTRILNEVLRLWADVGDRMRQMTAMLEDSLNRPRDESF